MNILAPLFAGDEDSDEDEWRVMPGCVPIR